MTPPPRLCCGKQHYGSRCSEDVAMCCICFVVVSVDDLAVDPEDGRPWDVCAGCAETGGVG